MSSIFSLIREGNVQVALIVVLSRCFVVFCCLPIHELAHGYMAYLLGDKTAKYEGRLTLNPLAHLDPLGTIMIFLFGIGYAKPVKVTPTRFKNLKGGMALTALAGPLSNLIMGWISVWAYFLFYKILPEGGISDAVTMFFFFAGDVNIMLAVFNLFPIPPLDGSKIIAAVLPNKIYFKYMEYERYIMIGLFALLFLGVLDKPISWLSDALFSIMAIIPALAFGYGF